MRRFPVFMARLRKAVGGNIAVEFAICAPVALVMLAGLFDFGRGVSDAMQLRSAARAGAEYATRFPSDTEGIRQAVILSGSLDAEATAVASVSFCECADGVSVACTGTCASGVVRTFVRVSVSQPFEGILPYPGIVRPENISSEVVLRVR